MTPYDYFQRKTPKYYPGMYLDSYSPEQILAAKHHQMFQEQEDSDTTELIIKSEVKTK